MGVRGLLMGLVAVFQRCDCVSLGVIMLPDIVVMSRLMMMMRCGVVVSRRLVMMLACWMFLRLGHFLNSSIVRELLPIFHPGD